MKDINSLNKNDAKKIIENLKKGIPPMDHVEYFTVGRDEWIEGIKEYITEDIKNGGSAVKFVKGNYGDGKTHFMILIRKYGFDENYAVSFVNIEDIKNPGRFEQFYKQIVENIAVKEKTKTCGIRGIFNIWYDYISKNPNTDFETELKKIRDESTIEVPFFNAIAFYVYSISGIKPLPFDKESLLIQWFNGEKIMPVNKLSEFSIFSNIDKGNSKNMLRSLVAFLRCIGYSGLIVLIDEIESIMKKSSKNTRDSAYENIRQIIDNTDRGAYILFVGAITPDSIETSGNFIKKNLVSYIALWSRIKQEVKSARINKRANIIDLKKTPLTKENFFEVALKIRDIYAKAHSWDPKISVTDDDLDLLSKTVYEERYSLDTSKLRVMIKSTVEYLEHAESDKTYKPTKEEIKDLIIKSIEDLKEKKIQKEKEEEKQME